MVSSAPVSLIFEIKSTLLPRIQFQSPNNLPLLVYPWRNVSAASATFLISILPSAPTLRASLAIFLAFN